MGHVPELGQSTGDWGAGANGIPGCIGDNQNGLGSPPCNPGGSGGGGPTGGGLAPGTDNPGSDDVELHDLDLDGDGVKTNALGVPRLGDPGTGSTPIPNPNAGDASASGLPGSLNDPNGAPTICMVGAGSIIDVNVLSVNKNNDSVFNVHRVSCPVRTDPDDPNETIADCWYDADGDDIDDTFDNCPEVSNSSQTDTDSDGVGDACDNCPSIANADQADTDTAVAAGDTSQSAGPDGVGDICDNCTVVANKRITALGFQTLTGNQLDDDGDGFGNHCDADFNNTDNLINPTDLNLFKVANGKKRNKAVCGGPCDIYDINGVDGLINPGDLSRFKELNGTKKNKKQWKKCTACPLPNL